MTQEEKDFLKDLCARLPYNVKGHRIWVAPLSSSPEECDTELDTFDIDCLSSLFDCGEAICKIDGHVRAIENYSFKPYLRPMSSMTEEEKEEYINIKQGECNGCVLTGKGDPNTEFLLVDFFNAHHFDYRGLIEKGLALKAKEGMYNTKYNESTLGQINS